MAEHIWSVLCYKAVVDRDTNQVSLLDVIEDATIAIPSPPKGVDLFAMPFPICVASTWMRSNLSKPETFSVRVVVVPPQGSEIPSSAVLVADDLETKMRLRTFMKVRAIPLRGGGIYRFAVEQRVRDEDPWRREASIPLRLQITEAAGPIQLQPKRTKRTKRTKRE